MVRFAAVLMTLWLGACCMTISTFAYEYENIHPERETSLSVYFGENEKGFSNVVFSIYRVADISDSGVYTLTGDFKSYPVSLENLDSSGWRALAQTLDAYAARDGLSPFWNEETGADGRFRLEGLPTGLYLVSGEQYTLGNTTYTPEPALISLPSLTDNGEWSYEVEISCKFDYVDTPDETTYLKVQKVWKDGGSSEGRPNEISIQLLENGNPVDTVVLSQENNWEHTWENLDSNSKWQVVEAEVPDGYTVTIVQEEHVFVITNTRPYEPPPKLPQTGLLWWPVPVLTCSGLLFVAAGLIVRRSRHGDSDEK